MNTWLKSLVALLALAFIASTPVAAQNNNNFNPTKEAVKEEQLLKALKSGEHLTGRISIPDEKAASLIQPAGQEWRVFHQQKLPIIGGLF